MSLPTQTDLNLPFISKMPKLDIGKTGLEKYLNEKLIGVAGKREVEVNALGRVIREISKQSSTQGQDVKISIDQRLQEFSHKQLEKHKAGIYSSIGYSHWRDTIHGIFSFI